MRKGVKDLILMGAIWLVFASPVFAGSIKLEDFGVATWFLLGLAAIILLLQLVPAAILFFGLVGTTTSLVFRKIKVGAEEEIESEALANSRVTTEKED